MSNRDFYVSRMKAESAAFAKVIRALPADKADYRPHPRSRSAAELAALFPAEVRGALELVKKHKVDWVDPKPDKNFAACADAFEKTTAELVKAVEKVDDAGWKKEAGFAMGGQVVWSGPLGEMLWGFLFDAIHHRGQLSTYIRPMGGKVPSIYGPSGDDPGA
ncbi:MAG TPA: DinB family protein [Thermoanaerobaculaceae bacterium]|nr:DinB family protein [Thermoanaerobaculaceae bacterium]